MTGAEPKEEPCNGIIILTEYTVIDKIVRLLLCSQMCMCNHACMGMFCVKFNKAFQTE